MIIKVDIDRFGYYIFADGYMFIEQRSIPTLPGNDGFAASDDAQKVALLVIQKIRQGDMPPTISMDEIKDLGILEVD